MTTKKPKKMNKIPVSGMENRATGSSRIKTEDLMDYKKFHRMMVTSLKVPSRKLHLKFKKDASSK